MVYKPFMSIFGGNMAFVSEAEKERIKSSVDLQEWAGRYTELRKHTNKELKGPCPK